MRVYSNVYVFTVSTLSPSSRRLCDHSTIHSILISKSIPCVLLVVYIVYIVIIFLFL